jgi:LPXTG-site transpeptidase (sortase) family protein
MLKLINMWRRKSDKRILIYIIGLSLVVLIYSSYRTYVTYEASRGDPEISTPAITSKHVYVDEELPKTLSIPSLNIETNIKHVGVTASGNMATPGNFSDVAWYKFGPAPGFTGSAVIAGHLDNALAINGVFKNLNKLQAGDDVYIESNGGTKYHFKVTDVKTYPYNDAPTEQIFNSNDAARLNLVTCAGEWDKKLKTYTERLVVYTALVQD